LQPPAAGQAEAASKLTTAARAPTVPATATSPPTATAETWATAIGPTEAVATAIAPVAAETPATSAAPFAPGAFAQGTAEILVLPGCFDFDHGVSAVPPDPACDFNVLPGPDSGTVQVYPIAAAQLAYAGVFPELPTLAQCAESNAFSGEPEIVAPLAAMYVCYQTGEGRLGYLHFTAADLEQAGTLTFDWVTFAAEVGAGSPSSEPPAGADLIYSNDAFGFRLALPETWAGFETSENEHGGVANICFTFAGSTPVCVLQIDVYTKAAWNNLEMVPDGYYLTENDQFVFAAGPYPPQCVQLDDFQCARYQEIPGILAGFTVE
jgi:hypothetical protein